MNIININTFDKVIIKPNTLIICDIDDTVLKFEHIDSKWWEKKYDYYLTQSQSNDPEQADSKTLESWIEHVITNNPTHTDSKGFERLLNKIVETKSELIFVTARRIGLEEITKKHFDLVNISNHNYKIYHIGNIPKGKFIKSNIQNDNFSHVIFIDDLNKNLESVFNVFGNKIVLYKFNC